MRAKIAVSLLFLAVLTTQSCGNEAPELYEPPEPTQEELQTAVVAALDVDGAVTDSPYVNRTETGNDTIDLATPSYDVEGQDSFKVPLEANTGTWTVPYFDAGGGEIWMITNSIPVHDDEGVFDVVTTDLPVNPPGKE